MMAILAAVGLERLARRVEHTVSQLPRVLHPTAPGDSAFLERLAELEDPLSALTLVWNAEHDGHVVRRRSSGSNRNSNR